MKLRYNIGFLAICLMILSGCSSTRYVPAGKYWLKKTKIELVNDDKKLSKSDFINLQKQTSNRRLLSFPLKLKMYSSVDINKTNWWSRMMQNSGEAPVIFDDTYADQTLQQMRQYLANKGHFNPTINYVCDTLGEKTLRVIYQINTGPSYRYRNVTLNVQDDSLKPYFDEWQSITPIKSGASYDVEVLENEGLRITRRMQNLGFYFFNKENIEFLIDSSLNANLMDIQMIVKSPRTGAHHQKYTYGEVYIFPDVNPNSTRGKVLDTTCYRISKSRTDTTMLNYYFVHTEPLRIRPYIVASKLLIQPGDAYNLTNIDQTYENLLDLRVYRSTGMNIQPDPIDTNAPQYLLNAVIDVKQAPTHTWTADFDVTNSVGLQGAAAYVTYQNKNLFGGAEIFSLRLRGLVELQYLFNKELRRQNNMEFVNNVDVKLEGSIDFPRFIAPFNLRRAIQYKPRTLVNLGYSHQFRTQYYNRSMVNMSFAYFWRKSNISHILFPLDINIVKINLTPNFTETLNQLSTNNERLRYLYGNHFIFAARYSFAYSGQRNYPISFNAFRFSVESSGNSLYLASNLLKAPKTESSMYRFFNLAYSQYIRLDAEVKRYWYLTNNQILVARLMAGSGFAYANSKVLPYEKGFSAGGNNNVRAWIMNQLGPGSYYNPDVTNIERIGDIVGVGNIEYRFPIYGAFKGALFMDVGNIWVHNDNESFPGGKFDWKEAPKNLAVGGGFGLRWDLGFFIIRLDAAIPLRNPERSNEKWVVSQTQFKDIVLNFGIGYPF